MQPLGDVLQHPVAEAVTEGVVDRLEVVDVDEQQRQALPAAGARERALELRGEAAAVGQLRQRIVVRKVMELAGALGDALLELGLVGAQLRFRVRDAIGHGVEGFGELVDLGRAAARGARPAVAAGEQPRGRGQPAHRHADAHREQRRHEQHQPEHGERGVPERMLGSLGRGGRVLRGLQQSLARGQLQLPLHADRERGAVLAQAVPERPALAVVALARAAQPGGFREVLSHQGEPSTARRGLEFRGVRVQHLSEFTLALGDNGRGGQVAAHRVDGGVELRERALRHHLRAIDGEPRAAGGNDAPVDVVEGRLAPGVPLQALRSAGRELTRVGDVTGELLAQSGGGGRDRARRRAAEVLGDRRLERIAGERDGAELVVGAVRLHVLADCAIVGDELFQHGVGSVGERLVLGLHAANGLEGLARGARGERLAEQQHGRDRGEPEAEPPADPEARAARRPARQPPQPGALGVRRTRGLRLRDFSDRFMHAT